MTSPMNDLSWKDRLAVEFARRDTTLRTVAREAAERGLKMNRSTASEIWRERMPPSDRFVAAVSIVLGVHPDDLGFTRTPHTELAYLAFAGWKQERGGPQ